VLGHEVALTIVEVGENLRDRYAPGDRFIVQADIYLQGVAYAYGYELQGGFSEYSIVDWRVLNGDDGNYLLPVQKGTGYAEAALNEPWACVVASYTVDLRSAWKPGGSLWIVGDGAGATLGKAAEWRPGSVTLELRDGSASAALEEWARTAGATLTVGAPDAEATFDDILVLTNDAETIERAFRQLKKGGTFAMVTPDPVERWVQLDIGRIHYDKLAVLGAASQDAGDAYEPIRTDLRAGGNTWVLGAGGPMGHMHVQRALEMDERPARIVASNLHLARIQALAHKFEASATEAGVAFVTVSQEQFASQEDLDEALNEMSGASGFDDIVVNAPSVGAVELAHKHLAPNGVMNVFAGLPRGTMCGFDANLIISRNIRYTGMSGSSIDDLRHMLALTESHALSTNRSVAAVAGLEGLPLGLKSVSEGRFSGKVVIYPHISGLPLTPLEELEEILPDVAAKLGEDGSWTNAAEEELLRTHLGESRS
jgi:D-arabinose 1-dehydrogenase-like Zn-dependent alcohol dehydrogenase